MDRVNRQLPYADVPAYDAEITASNKAILLIAIDNLKATAEWAFIVYVFFASMISAMIYSIYYLDGIDDNARRFTFIAIVLQCYAATQISITTRNNNKADLLLQHAGHLPKMTPRFMIETLRGTPAASFTNWALMVGSTVYALWILFYNNMEEHYKTVLIVTNIAMVAATFVLAKHQRDNSEATTLLNEYKVVNQ